MPSCAMARRRALVLAVSLTSMATLASATSSTQVAFTGCLGVCVNHNGCGASNTNCVCLESAESAFLDNVVSCIANFCLLSDGDNSVATANSVIDVIDSQFLEVVSDVCAADKQSVPASKISAALSSASSLVSIALGVTPTTVTTHATTTKTVPKAGATSTSSSSIAYTTSKTTSETTSEAPTTSTTVAAETTTDKKDTTTSTATTKQAATTTKQAPAKDTTDSSPFTNTREDSAAARPFGPAPWTVAAAAAVPLFLSMGLGLL